MTTIETDPGMQWNARKADKVRPLTCGLCPSFGQVVKENFHNEATPDSNTRNGPQPQWSVSPTAEFASIGAHRTIGLLSVAMKWH
jgi:hypothetical protein